MRTLSTKRAGGRPVKVRHSRTALVAIATLACSVTAQLQTAKITAEDAVLGDRFGYSVSVDGDTAIVGAPGSTFGIGVPGYAYVFVRDARGSWQQQAKLIGSGFGAAFGVSVSLSGDTAIVGSPFDPFFSSEPGAAYVFVRDASGAWTQQSKLVAEDFFPAGNGDRFGHSVALDGDTAIVGAYRDDNTDVYPPFGLAQSGSAVVFVRGTSGSWTRQAKLTAPAALGGEWFGLSVSLSGDTALVGAAEGFARPGSAHVFARDAGGNWSREGTLAASDGGPGDRFGTSVSVSGDTALVGAYLDDGAAGSAYAFTRDGSGMWSEQEKLAVSGSMWFGHSVSLRGEAALIGAPGENLERGAAYRFVRDGSGSWLQPDRVAAADGAAGDRFGYSVSFKGDTAFVGAPEDSDDGEHSGSAYVFCIGEDKLTAGDPAAGDSYGFSVSLGGGDALVGAINGGDRGSDSGAAYVLGRDAEGDWTQQARLTATDGAAGDAFGASVSISGNTALVGANQDDDNGTSSGSAYVFERDGNGLWNQQAKLTGSDASAGDRFGQSLSLSGNTALVSAIGDDDGGSLAGAAYVFEGSNGTWKQRAKLTATDAAPGDSFGYSVSVSGDTALVGAWRDDDAGTDSGSAYVFTRGLDGRWTQRAKLTARGARPGDLFGSSVALGGDTALVGARGQDGPLDSGAAYVFVRDPLGNWAQQGMLTATDAAAGDRFGISVSVSGDMAVVGADLSDGTAVDSGSAYVFTRDPGTGNWTQHLKLTADDADLGDAFGYAVALNGDTALAGAWRHDAAGTDSGAAYAFCIGVGIPATFSTFGQGCPGTVGIPTLTAAQGDRPWIGESLELELAGMPADLSNTPFGFLGLSNTRWQALPLPLDLTSLGFWNCTAYVSVDAMVVLVNNLGTAVWELPIPLNPNLIGLHLYLQGGVFDFGVNPNNFILTNAGEAVVGIR